jgi:hypothetical protein
MLGVKYLAISQQDRVNVWSRARDFQYGDKSQTYLQILYEAVLVCFNSYVET